MKKSERKLSLNSTKFKPLYHSMPSLSILLVVCRVSRVRSLAEGDGAQGGGHPGWNHTAHIVTTL